jgi:hypothetical protein
MAINPYELMQQAYTAPQMGIGGSSAGYADWQNQISQMTGQPWNSGGVTPLDPSQLNALYANPKRWGEFAGIGVNDPRYRQLAALGILPPQGGFGYDPAAVQAVQGWTPQGANTWVGTPSLLGPQQQQVLQAAAQLPGNAPTTTDSINRQLGIGQKQETNPMTQPAAAQQQQMTTVANPWMTAGYAPKPQQTSIAPAQPQQAMSMGGGKGGAPMPTQVQSQQTPRMSGGKGG